MPRFLHRVLSLYYEYGSYDYIGEPVSQLTHAIQCYYTARNDLKTKENIPDDDKQDILIAALLHDVGHLLSSKNKMIYRGQNVGNENHEVIGSDFLRELDFNDLTCSLVRNHVKSKRYLVSKDENYSLSDGSRMSLELQGGKMSREECKDFEGEPYFYYHLMFRRYDDSAKDLYEKKFNYHTFKKILEELTSTVWEKKEGIILSFG